VRHHGYAVLMREGRNGEYAPAAERLFIRVPSKAAAAKPVWSSKKSETALGTLNNGRKAEENACGNNRCGMPPVHCVNVRTAYQQTSPVTVTTPTSIWK